MPAESVTHPYLPAAATAAADPLLQRLTDDKYQLNAITIHHLPTGDRAWIPVDLDSMNWYAVEMSLTTFKIGKKEFVVIPRRRYNQLTRTEQDQRDAEIAAKGQAAYLAGKMKTISHEELKQKLGL